MIKSAELENSAYEFEAKMPLRHAVPLGLQHVFAMFVGNLTPLLIITAPAASRAVSSQTCR